MGRNEPVVCATELSGVLLENLATGALHTMRLLTLLGTMRQPVPACPPFCLDLLRDLSTTSSPPPTDAILGAAAVVAHTRPQSPTLNPPHPMVAQTNTWPRSPRVVITKSSWCAQAVPSPAVREQVAHTLGKLTPGDRAMRVSRPHWNTFWMTILAEVVERADELLRLARGL